MLFCLLLTGNLTFAKSWEQDQDKTLSGTVTEQESGEPLIGATIVVKGTTVGTITDVEGNFRLSAPEDAKTLIVSFLGFESMEVEIGNQTTFDIAMDVEVSSLNDVVVIGYGTETKDKFNGAVSKVETETLNNFSSANFEQSLAGLKSGIQIVGNNKNPGDNSVIQIRGISTLTAGTSPLIVVDGLPLTEGSTFSSINTNDIESVNILKDAASASIYGSRASNGVILITTKKGQKGTLQVSYDGYYGSQKRIDEFELADAYGTAQFDLDARNFGYVSGGPGRSVSDDNATRDANGGGKRSRVQPFLQDYVNGVPGLPNTNWTDAVFRTAQQQSHTINLMGGSENNDYSISLGYFDQENIIVGSDYERFSNNIRFNSEVTDRIRYGISTNLSYALSNPTGERGWSDSRETLNNQADPAFSIILMQPYYPVRNPDGSLAIGLQIDDNNDNWDGPISENTVAHVKLADFDRTEFRVFGNTYLEIEPINNLIFKTSFGGDFNSWEEEFFGTSTYGNYRTPVANNPTRSAKRDRVRENIITENTLKYNATLDQHNFNVLVGYSYQQELVDRVDSESQDFPDDNIRNIGGATTVAQRATKSKWALESFFSRLQYDFDSRYSVSASVRRDGSSRFGANTKYGTFASFSAGWTFSNEAFFPENDILSFAKIRASWGQTGNNQIGNYGSISEIANDNYVIDGALNAGAYISSSPNPDLSWETNSATNIGLDLGFLEDRILLTAEYYISTTEDILLDVPVPQQSGFSESLRILENWKIQGSNWRYWAEDSISEM